MKMNILKKNKKTKMQKFKKKININKKMGPVMWTRMAWLERAENSASTEHHIIILSGHM